MVAAKKGSFLSFYERDRREKRFTELFASAQIARPLPTSENLLWTQQTCGFKTVLTP